MSSCRIVCAVAFWGATAFSGLGALAMPTERIVYATKGYGGHSGATGDGQTDDAAALRALIAAMSDGMVLDGEGYTYKVNSGLTLRPCFEFRNARVDFSGADNSAVLFTVVGGTMSGAVGIIGPLKAGAVDVKVANTKNFKPDDYLWIASDEYWDSKDSDKCRVGEMHQIRSLQDSKLTCYDPILYDMESNLRVAKINWAEDVILRKVRATGNGMGAHGNQQGLWAPYVKNLLLEDCEFTKFDMRCVSTDRCLKAVVRGGLYGYANKTGYSYGIAINNGCYGTKISNVHFRDCRHGVTHGDNRGPNRYTIVDGCTCTAMRESGLDSHTAADHIIFSNNVIESIGKFKVDGECDGAYGILVRSTNTQVLNNRIINPGSTGIFMNENVTAAAGTCEVIGNTILGVPKNCTGIYVRNSLAGAMKSVKVHDNTIIGSSNDGSCGVAVKASAGNIHMISICGNSIQNTACGVRVENRESFFIERLMIHDNLIEACDCSAPNGIVVAGQKGNRIVNVSICDNNLTRGGSGVINGTGIYCKNEEHMIVNGNLVRGFATPIDWTKVPTTLVVNNLEN